VRASTTASAVAIFEDSATAACVATVSATCNRVQNAASVIVCAASVVANGRKKWEPEPDTPETWTPVAENSKTWQDAGSTPESWSAVSPTSTDWTPASASSETWADAA
jgi:hypothetical protein